MPIDPPYRLDPWQNIINVQWKTANNWYLAHFLWLPNSQIQQGAHNPPYWQYINEGQFNAMKDAGELNDAYDPWDSPAMYYEHKSALVTAMTSDLSNQNLTGTISSPTWIDGGHGGWWDSDPYGAWLSALSQYSHWHSTATPYYVIAGYYEDPDQTA